MTHLYALLHRCFLQFPLCVGLLLLARLTTTAQTIRYVSTTGTNANPATATSWANSTTNLQGAINASSANDQVWVKAGLYKPTSTTGPTSQTISFAMKAGVAIYGGFVGTETTLNQRPPVNLTTPSSTTLSGEIGNPASTTDNSYHVISNPTGLTTAGTPTAAILDGFVITGGNANGSYPDNVGGGIYNNGSGPGNFCSPTIRNCLFHANNANLGGAIYNDGYQGISSPSLTNCAFQANSAWYGGAMYNNGFFSGTSSPILTNCAFQNNTASSDGGAMYNQGTSGGSSSPSLTNCSFQANTADTGRAGAMYNDGTSSPSLTNCSFRANTATYGGAMFNDSNNGTSSPGLTNCSFQANTATYGGAMVNYGYSGLTNNPSRPRLTNCSFQANTASTGGGAMVNYYTAVPSLTNCVLFGNGGGTTFVNVETSILARHSLFDASVTGYNSVTGNLTTTTSPFASTATVQLAAGSPAINAGDPATTTATGAPAAVGNTDLAGNPRFVGGRIDMGAYEFCYATSRLYVRAGATGANTGLSWADAFTDLQTALIYGCSGSLTEVWVANGLYKPTLTTGPASRSISFSMRPNVAIYGGFVGTETTLGQRPPVNLTTPSGTTLSGEIGNPAITTDNSYHVISNPTGLTNTAILDGFVITGGNATNGSFADNSGGGIYNNGSGSGNFCSPTIRNCLFQANSANDGGAMYNDGYQGSSSPSLNNCSFQSNTANVNGGAMYNAGFLSGVSRPSLTNCSFQSNTASVNGGAMYNDGSLSGTSSASLTNCVLFGNGGGNSIVNNTATVLARYSLFEPSSVTVTGFTSVTGNLTVTGTPATTSPFASTATIRLAANSPAINAADPASTSATVGTTDGAGLPRFVGTLDMGALEFQNEIFTVKTGNWSDPTVWNVNRLPQLGDRARLKHAVTLPASYAAFVGRLLYDSAGRLLNSTGGRLRIEP